MRMETNPLELESDCLGSLWEDCIMSFTREEPESPPKRRNLTDDSMQDLVDSGVDPMHFAVYQDSRGVERVPFSNGYWR
jgi:hypothetical protein